MEPFFSIWLKELNPFQYYWKNWTLFNIWLEDLNICSIELFQYDSKDEIFPIWFEELNPPFWWFTDLTFLVKWVKYLNPFWTWLKELNFFSSDSHSWALFFNWLTEWNFLKLLLEWFFLQKTLKELKELNPSWISLKKIELFFDNMTQRTFFCWIWQKELFLPFFMTPILGPFSHDSNNWTFFFTWLKYLYFFENFWFKELDPLLFQDSKFHQSKKTHRIKLLWIRPTELIFFCEYDPQNWSFFFEYDQRIGLLFLEYDAKNWTFCFLSMTQWIEPLNYLNMTQRIQPFFFWIWIQPLFWIWRKELNSFSWVWRKDLDPFSNMTERIGPFFQIWKKEMFFFFQIWLKEFFCMSPRMEIF